MFVSDPIKKIFLFVVMMTSFTLKGQHIFQGSFIMSFKSSSDKGEDPPMLWNIKPALRGGEMAMELQDEMLKKGVSKRVLFNPKDSTWTMLMSFNNVKQGSRMHRAEMFRKKSVDRKIKTSVTAEQRTIDGYKCKKWIAESKNHKAEIWITETLRFDVCNLYKLLNHCSMMSDSVRKGDWFNVLYFRGMIMEVTSKKNQQVKLTL